MQAAYESLRNSGIKTTGSRRQWHLVLTGNIKDKFLINIS